MRRPEPQPYLLIIPIHIARQLASVERSVSMAIRDELKAIAVRFGHNPPAWSASRSQSLSIQGFTVEYECDPRNEAIVAMHMTKKS